MRLFFRPQLAESFEEALAEKKSYGRIDEFLNEHLGEGITIIYYCYDGRVHADTFTVHSIRHHGVIGFLWYEEGAA